MDIFGFQKGKIKIKLNNYNFMGGDTIEGILELTLKKPLQAKELSIQIIAEESRYNSNDNSQTWSTVFDFKQPLDGEKEYPAQVVSCPFKIAIPKNNEPNAELPGGVFGIVLQHLGNMSRRSLKWSLTGRLVVSGFDITKKVSINVV